MDRRFVILTGVLSALTFGGVWLLTGPKGQSAVVSGVYYPGCNSVREAGKAPLYRGEPGYRPEMDGDNDGIACEPYPR
ncbi:excalibur calcium-binding domain-containing protein [Sphingomonas sp. 4RDLI-65]|jgi:hypothetical protein|uniref:excalibur calcium-binding domain-containing protein n=1 Tax=Sphingomonas sp. 4RDLI-65 TaxID=3111641 RepID=UPI003C238557